MCDNPLDDIENLWDSATNAFNNLVHQIQNAFNNGVTWIAGQINNLGNELATTVNDVVQFVGNALQEAATGLYDLAVGYVNILQKAYDSAEALFHQIDPTLYDQINSALKSA